MMDKNTNTTTAINTYNSDITPPTTTSTYNINNNDTRNNDDDATAMITTTTTTNNNKKNHNNIYETTTLKSSTQQKQKTTVRILHETNSGNCTRDDVHMAKKRKPQKRNWIYFNNITLTHKCYKN